MIFGLTKDVCCSIYVHLSKCVTSFAKRHWFGIYHASMSDDGKARNQHAFKFGQMRVII